MSGARFESLRPRVRTQDGINAIKAGEADINARGVAGADLGQKTENVANLLAPVADAGKALGPEIGGVARVGVSALHAVGVAGDTCDAGPETHGNWFHSARHEQAEH